MLILTKCACCDAGLWEDMQQHVCESCGNALCPKCADMEGDAENVFIPACPKCQREAAPKFTQVNHPAGVAHLHDSRVVWVVRYGDGDPDGDYFVYRSTARVPKGRFPWTVDNRRHGRYRTLDAALVAADAVAA